MKKLISAASALAMAASMVGSAVPFATGAADASKTYELRAFVDKDGKAVSTTISEDAIKAGDVIIPVGFYYVEQTKDTTGIRAQWTVNSKDGDASNKNITFNQCEPGSAYFNKGVQTVTIDGKEEETNMILGFAGTVTKNRKGVVFNHPSPDTVVFSVDTKQDSSNCKNAFGSAVWTPQADGSYEYFGEKSDDYPVTVFEVVFAKGTPAGTYTLDFIDYADDPAAPQNSTCQVESKGSGTMTAGNKKLNLKSLEITIGGNATPAETTTAKPAETTTTAKSTEAPTTTTAAPTTPSTPAGPAQTVDGQKDFIITAQDVTMKAGEEKEVEFSVSSGDHVVVLTQCEFDIPEGFGFNFEDKSVYCVEHNAAYTALGNQWTATLKDPKTADAVPLDDDEPIAVIKLTAPKGAKTGTTYQYGMKMYHVVEDSFKPIEFDATVKYGTITIDNGDAPVTTPAETTTTKAPETTTTKAAETTTTAKPAETTTAAQTTAPSTPVGNAVYGDVNCDGKVNIADVVVLNKYLNDAKSYNMTAQGLINADCESVGNGVNAKDSDAIIKSIVHLVKLPC